MRKNRLRVLFSGKNGSDESEWLEYLIQVAILLSCVTFALETLPSIKEPWKTVIKDSEYFFIAFFTLEYVLRMYYSEKRWKYVSSFMGVIDLIAILPFYLSLGFDLRSLRILRIFRVFRAFKLLRYNSALRRIRTAAIIAKEEIVLFLVLTTIMIFLVSSGIYYFENESQPEHFSSVFHSLWWSVVTLTTVGYGDVYPVTVGGRIFTFFVLLLGVGIVTIPAGIVASALQKARELEEQG